MLKIIGVIMIFTAFSWAGFSFSTALRRKTERLENERKLTEDLSTLIRYRALTLREIVSQLSDNPSYKKMGFIIYTAGSDRFVPFPEAWEKGVQKDTELSRMEKDILIKMGYELGKTDMEGQLAALSLYGGQLEKRLSEENEKYLKKGKMYRSLGVLFGAMAGILFI
ncbi:MAG: stage III sporulation protein AB [Porcipelethomonas sp.]